MSRTGDRAWRKIRAEVLDESTICWLCGHDGADSVDHITSVKDGGTDDYENLAPAHFQPCPTCDLRCNLKKGSKSINTVHEATPSKKWY